MSEILEYSVDLKNAEAPVPLPVGQYPFEIRGAELKAANAKGNRVLALNLYIAPESYRVDFTEGNPDGTTVTYNRLVFKDDVVSRFQMRKFLEAVGAKLSNKVDPNTLIGLTGTVEIANEEWEGVPRATATKIIAK